MRQSWWSPQDGSTRSSEARLALQSCPKLGWKCPGGSVNGTSCSQKQVRPWARQWPQAADSWGQSAKSTPSRRGNALVGPAGGSGQGITAFSTFSLAMEAFHHHLVWGISRPVGISSQVNLASVCIFSVVSAWYHCHLWFRKSASWLAF